MKGKVIVIKRRGPASGLPRCGRAYKRTGSRRFNSGNLQRRASNATKEREEGQRKREEGGAGLRAANMLEVTLITRRAFVEIWRGAVSLRLRAGKKTAARRGEENRRWKRVPVRPLPSNCSVTDRRRGLHAQVGGLSDSERARSTMAAVTGRHAAFYQLNKVKLQHVRYAALTQGPFMNITVLWTSFSSSLGVTTLQAAANTFKTSAFHQETTCARFSVTRPRSETAGSHSWKPQLCATMVFINKLFLYTYKQKQKITADLYFWDNSLVHLKNI